MLVPEKRHTHPRVYCGQTAGWIKIPLGMEVNVGSGIVLDGVAASPKSAQPTSFRFMSIVATLY